MRGAVLAGLVALSCAACRSPAPAVSSVAAATAWTPPSAGAPSPWLAPAPAESVLPSGVKLAVLRQRGLLAAHLTAIVKAGSALDGARQGLAAATAEMVLAGGAGRRSGVELAAAFAALGDEPHLTVDGDDATFQLTLPPAALPAALSLLADVLQRPRFDAAEWRGERARRVAELESERDEPAAVADRVFARVHHGDHPYGHAAAGRARDVAALETTDLRAFHAAHYAAAATTLIVIIDLPPFAEAPGADPAAIAAAAFAGWSRPAPPAPGRSARSSPPPPTSEPAHAARLVLVDHAGAPQSELRVGAMAVARASPDFPSVMLLETVLGGSFTSRLVQNLRETHGYAYDVTARVVAADAAAPLLIKTAVRTDVTAAAVGEIRTELRRLRQPLTALELARARALVRGVLIDGFGDGQGASLLLAEGLGHGVDGAWWSRLPGALAALDAERLASDAARLVNPDRLTVVVVGDRHAVEAGLRALPGGGALELLGSDGEPPAATTSRPRSASIK